MSGEVAVVEPAEARPRRSRLSRWSWLPLLLPAIVLLLLLAGAFGLFAYRSVFPAHGAQIGLGEALRAGALDGFYWSAMLRTFLLAITAATLAAVMSLIIADALVTLDRPVITAITGAALFSPLVVSMTVRAYGWLLILDQRPIDETLSFIGERLRFMEYTPSMLATIFVMGHAMMPLAAFPIIARLKEIDKLRISPAARDLGASATTTFLRVVAPLAAPTMLRVGALTFGLAMGAFGIPAIVGRGRVQVVSELVYQNLIAVDWPTAFLRLVALLLVTAVVVAPVFWLAARLSKRSVLSAGGGG